MSGQEMRSALFEMGNLWAIDYGTRLRLYASHAKESKDRGIFHASCKKYPTRNAFLKVYRVLEHKVVVGAWLKFTADDAAIAKLLRSEKWCDGHYKFAKNVPVQRGVDAAGSRDSRRMKKRVLYVALNEHNYEMKGKLISTENHAEVKLFFEELIKEGRLDREAVVVDNGKNIRKPIAELNEKYGFNLKQKQDSFPHWSF
eukprot:Nk52_evm9s1916 gene=Nk52_evmTU9s1916